MGKQSKQQTKIERFKGMGWAEGIATAFVRAGGRCEYCGVDLLHDRLGYGVGELEHLLPKSKHPEVEHCPDNWVLSCHPCNVIKGRLDVSQFRTTRRVTPGFVRKNRRSLVTDARTHIYAKRAESHDPEWLQARAIMDG